MNIRPAPRSRSPRSGSPAQPNAMPFLNGARRRSRPTPRRRKPQYERNAFPTDRIATLLSPRSRRSGTPGYASLKRSARRRRWTDNRVPEFWSCPAGERRLIRPLRPMIRWPRKCRLPVRRIETSRRRSSMLRCRSTVRLEHHFGHDCLPCSQNGKSRRRSLSPRSRRRTGRGRCGDAAERDR